MGLIRNIESGFPLSLTTLIVLHLLKPRKQRIVNSKVLSVGFVSFKGFVWCFGGFVNVSLFCADSLQIIGIAYFFILVIIKYAIRKHGARTYNLLNPHSKTI